MGCNKSKHDVVTGNTISKNKDVSGSLSKKNEAGKLSKSSSSTSSTSLSSKLEEANNAISLNQEQKSDGAHDHDHDIKEEANMKDIAEHEHDQDHESEHEHAGVNAKDIAEQEHEQLGVGEEKKHGTEEEVGEEEKDEEKIEIETNSKTKIVEEQETGRLQTQESLNHFISSRKDEEANNRIISGEDFTCDSPQHEPGNKGALVEAARSEDAVEENKPTGEEAENGNEELIGKEEVEEERKHGTGEELGEGEKDEEKIEVEIISEAVIVEEQKPGTLITRDSLNHSFSSRKDEEALKGIVSEGSSSPRHEPGSQGAVGDPAKAENAVEENRPTGEETVNGNEELVIGKEEVEAEAIPSAGDEAKVSSSYED